MPETKKAPEPGATRNEDPTPVKPADLQRLVNEVREAEKTIAAGERQIIAAIKPKEEKIVSAMFALARHLATLRSQVDEAQERWSHWRKLTGLHPKTAERYQQLGKSFLADERLNESDLLSRLPRDLLKLAAIAQLNEDQLQELLAKMDLKKTPRPKVIAAVHELRGTKPGRKTTPLKKRVDRTLTQAGQLAKELKELPPGEDQGQSLALLRDGLRAVLDGLKVPSAAA